MMYKTTKRVLGGMGIVLTPMTWGVCVDSLHSIGSQVGITITALVICVICINWATE